MFVLIDHVSSINNVRINNMYVYPLKLSWKLFLYQIYNYKLIFSSIWLDLIWSRRITTFGILCKLFVTKTLQIYNSLKWPSSRNRVFVLLEEVVKHYNWLSQTASTVILNHLTTIWRSSHPYALECCICCFIFWWIASFS